MPSKRKPTRKRLQRVSVRAELRDEPDWDKFAYALLQHVKLVSAQKDKAIKAKRKRSSP
jgi:hypothetical protein